MTKNILNAQDLKSLAINAIEELKAQDVIVLDVRGKSNFTDFMVVASGSSDRHLKAMANEVHVKAKESGNPPLSTEGADSSDWILVDLGDVIVHLMRPEIREAYDLETLWSMEVSNRNPENA